jgi:5-formyltetrahydrofolate cyclo-ligase
VSSHQSDAGVSAIKQTLRVQVIAALKALSTEQRLDASRAIRARLETQNAWQKARSVLLFAPTPNEPDLWPLLTDALAAGKTIALPRFHTESGKFAAARIRNPVADIRPGRFGIREPHEHCDEISLDALDFILVPGVAFDVHGRRLGRGMGYYDQLLARAGGTKCGVAFDEQMVSEIPVEPHDVLMNCLVTPTRWIEV